MVMGGSGSLAGDHAGPVDAHGKSCVSAAGV